MEKRQCTNCKTTRELEQFRGNNLTCLMCAKWHKTWADRNPERVKENWQRYAREHKEEIQARKKVYNKEYNQREIECEVCKYKMKKGHWPKHIKTKTHLANLEKTEEENTN